MVQPSVAHFPDQEWRHDLFIFPSIAIEASQVGPEGDESSGPHVSSGARGPVGPT
jgi:hypothetical protein